MFCGLALFVARFGWLSAHVSSSIPSFIFFNELSYRVFSFLMSYKCRVTIPYEDIHKRGSKEIRTCRVHSDEKTFVIWNGLHVGSGTMLNGTTLATCGRNVTIPAGGGYEDLPFLFPHRNSP